MQALRPSNANAGVLRESITRGQELAKQEQAVKNELELEERAKQEQMRALLEKRKSYARTVSSPRKESPRHSAASPKRPKSPTRPSSPMRPATPPRAAQGGGLTSPRPGSPSVLRPGLPSVALPPGALAEASRKRVNPMATPHRGGPKKKQQPRRPPLAVHPSQRGAMESTAEGSEELLDLDEQENDALAQRPLIAQGSSEELLAHDGGSFEELEAACNTAQHTDAEPHANGEVSGFEAGAEGLEASDSARAVVRAVSPSEGAHSEVDDGVLLSARSETSSASEDVLFERATFSESPRATPRSHQVLAAESSLLSGLPLADAPPPSRADNRLENLAPESRLADLPMMGIPPLGLAKLEAARSSAQRERDGDGATAVAVAAAGVVEGQAKATDEVGVMHPAVKQQVGGSLFSRLRMAGSDRDEVVGQSEGKLEGQRLEAMSEQLDAVTTCMRSEQQARVESERKAVQLRERVRQLEAERDEEKSAHASLRGLLVQLQAENTGLKDQNEQLAQDCRALLSHRDE